MILNSIRQRYAMNFVLVCSSALAIWWSTRCGRTGLRAHFVLGDLTWIQLKLLRDQSLFGGLYYYARHSQHLCSISLLITSVNDPSHFQTRGHAELWQSSVSSTAATRSSVSISSLFYFGWFNCACWCFHKFYFALRVLCVRFCIMLQTIQKCLQGNLNVFLMHCTVYKSVTYVYVS